MLRTVSGTRPCLPELSIVIPTYNERENICPLITLLRIALSGIAWEVVFVDDDSPDGTASHIREITTSHPEIRVLSRIEQHGLASACITGILATTAPYVAVMDADLQHDESVLPEMLKRLRSENLDIVIASRNLEGGSMGNFPLARVGLSRLGAKTSQLVCGHRISDPMSGFFVVRRSFFEEVAEQLSGRGFKILIDILASSPRPVRFSEVPYHFRDRRWGKSKLNLWIELEYLRFLVEKLVKRRVLERCLAT